MLEQCLRSLLETKQAIDFEIIVVDNASQDSSLEMLSGYPQVVVIENDTNVGFAVANNQGMRIARGQYFLLLNSDTIVTDHALATMVAFMRSHPEAGALGCKLLNPDGTLQRSCGMFPTLFTEFLDQTMLHVIFPIYKLGYWDYSDAREVDWATGACMLVRRQAIEEIGGLDENIYMFYEDIDWCYRLRKAGWKVFYTPEAEVMHLKGQSSESVLPRMLVIDQQSTYYFFGKHYSRWRVQALRLVTSLGVIVRSVFWAAKWLSQGGRAKAKERLRGYQQILYRTWMDHEYVWAGRGATTNAGGF